MSKVLFLALVAFMLVSCGGKTTVVQGGGDGRPMWVAKGSGAFTQDGRKVFRTVGISSDLGDESMTITAAGDAARVELGKLMQTYVKSLSESYKRSMKTGDMEKAQFEQDVMQVSEVMAKAKFSGAQIIDSWTDPKTRSVYSLLELDLEAVNDIVKSSGISQQLIDTVGKRSEEAHAKLEEKLKDL